jgi:two-component system alkaline phosphatase synthesis response regulator PhoP
VKVLVKHSVKGTQTGQSLNAVHFGGNEINFVTFSVKNYEGKTFELSKREIALLKLLIDRKDSVVSQKSDFTICMGLRCIPFHPHNR